MDLEILRDAAKIWSMPGLCKDDVFPRAMYSSMFHRLSSNALIRALSEKKSSQDIVTIIEEQPELVRQADESQLLQKKYFPIHAACEYQASLIVIQRLISIYPQGLQQVCNDEDLPVFLVCKQQNPDLPVLEHLIHQYPDCLRGNQHHLPLYHYVCRLLKKPYLEESWEIMMNIIQSHDPEVLQQADSSGRYPAHYLVQANFCLAYLQQHYLNDNKNSQCLVDAHGNHLLHYAVQVPNNDDMVQFLIRKFPETLTIPNHQGELPIHRSSKQLSYLLPLAQADPLALLYSNHQGKTAIQLLQASKNQSWQRSVIQAHADPELEFAILDKAVQRLEQYEAVLKELDALLQKTVVPPLEQGIAKLLQNHKAPEDVLAQILEYTIPHC